MSIHSSSGRAAAIFGVLVVLLFLPYAVPAGPVAAAPASATRAVPSSSGTTDGNYIIGPGDTLQVFVWRSPDLSVTVPVRPDGRISTPLVQDMDAVGKTPAQLARDMEGVLGKYLRSPLVNIIVTNPLGELSAVKVIGQVAHPEAVPFHKGMTVMDVLLQVGGLTQYAAGNRATIVRTEKGEKREIRVQLDRLMEKGDLTQNLPIEPGDVLVVPETYF